MLQDGTELYVIDGMKMNEGILATKKIYGEAYGEETAVTIGNFYYEFYLSNEATIHGNLEVHGGQVIIYYGEPMRCAYSAISGQSTNLLSFGRLRVTGDIKWLDGTYTPLVWGAGGNENYADRWYCDGTFEIFNIAWPCITPGSVSENGTLNTPPTAGNKHWVVIEGKTALIGAPGVVSTWCELEPLLENPKKVYIRTPIQ